MNDDPFEQARKVGESLEAHTTPADSRRPRFDGTINLGHILTILTLVIGGMTMWTNFRVAQSDQESRIKALENSNIELRATLATLSRAQQDQQVTLHEISITLSFLAKKSTP